MRKANEHLTPRAVYKLQDVLNQNMATVPLSAGSKKIIAGLSVSFDQKIKEKAHPFEQCFLFYEAFTTAFPEENLLASELFSRMTAGFGYSVPVGIWDWTIHWVKNRTLIWNLRSAIHLMI